MEQEHIGSRIRAYRERKGLTVAELAQGIVSPHMVELTEQAMGDPSPKVVKRLAERLGVPCDELARGTKYELDYQHQHVEESRVLRLRKASWSLVQEQ